MLKDVFAKCIFGFIFISLDKVWTRQLAKAE